MLHLDRLTLTQGTFRLTADWRANPGDRIAILGPSGGGKSMLLSAIAGFLSPSAGRIRWQGQDITDTPPGERPVSILFQDQNLFPHLTVARNLALGINPGLAMAPGDAARIDDVLARTGLSGMGDRRPATLSGGQQGRVALARALLRARPVLLLDEPFAALGPALKAEMLALLAEVAAQTNALTLLVTHDPADARRFAPLTVLVANGIAHAPAATGPLLDTPPPALAAYLGP
ncbi:MAG: thiamine ABC transporter ATP-binding protein [Gemmobacter sp.]